MNTISSGFDNPAAHTTANVCVQNTSFTGNITNEGTISPSGIALVNGTVTGSISSTGVVKGGISLDSHSAITALGSAIFFSAPTFTGGISNAGTISAGGTGILAIGNISTFASGITNNGTISAFTNGVLVGGATAAASTLSAFSGGISNGGMITTSTRNGIIVGGTATNAFHIFPRSGTISTFIGGISNSGTISSVNANGIIVGGKATFNGLVSILSFSGDISNGGTVTAGHGIVVGGLATDFTGTSTVSISKFSGSIVNGNAGTITSLTGSGILVGGAATGSHAAVTVSTFTGNISNAGTITAATHGIFVGGTAGFGGSVSISTFSGGITNSGTISSAVANGIMVGGSASFGSMVTIGTFAGGITNAGTITASAVGVAVGGGAALGSALSLGLFENDIVNAKGASITASTGILVGGSAAFGSVLALSKFSGNIVNSGNIAATGSGSPLVNGAGIWLGGVAGFGSNLGIGTFTGAISNNLGATITGNVGILVGGDAVFGSSLTIGTVGNGITNAGTIAALNVGIWVGGAAAFGSNVAINTFAGGISNSGIVSSSGIGIFVGGISDASSSVTISNFSGGITNSGTINAGLTGISVTDVSTFIGNIANRGTIVAGSVGIFVCNCATFAGGSIVNTGSITAATGILVHNFAPVSIFDSGTIVGTGGTAVDLTGASGGNTFTLGPGYSIMGNVLAFAGGNDTFQLGGIGGDTFDLSRVDPSAQYQNFANFNVVSGTWTVTGTFGQSQAWNVLGGTLAGTGTLSGLNIDAGAILEPGTIGTPGTFMTVTGNLAFQPGAIYLINISPTAASRMNVGGSVSLAGAVDVILAPGAYNGKTTYDILDPSGISGQFSGVTILNDPGLGGTLTYQPNDVLLNLTAQLGSGGGLNQNQQNVANGINSFFNNGGPLPTAFFPLFTLTGANLAHTLTLLDGEAATGAQRGAFEMMDQFLELMLDPSPDGRLGGTATPMGFAPERDAGLPSDATLAYAGILKAAPAPSHPSPASGGGLGWGNWSVWGASFGGYNKTNGDPVVGSTTTMAHDGGAAAGLDYRLSPDSIVGFALAGGGTNWALSQGLGGGRSDAFQAGVYGKTQWGPVYAAGALAYANHWLSTSRLALGDQLVANFDGQSYGARFETGRRFAALFGGTAIGLTPYAAVQAQSFHTPTYGEADIQGGAFGLAYDAMTATDTRSELGARFDEVTAINGLPLVLRGRAAWAHDWVSNPALAAVFQGLPGSSFVVNGAAPPTDSALTSASAELHLRPNWSFSAKLESEFASRAQTYSGTATLRYLLP